MAVLSDVNPFVKPPAGDNMFAQITDNVSRIAETPRPPRAWYIAFGAALSLLGLFLISVSWVVWNGIGTWGNMMPVAWALTGTRLPVT